MTENSKFINFYGRRLGHLSNHSKYLLKVLLPQYAITPQDIVSNIFEGIGTKYKQIYLEIGFGGGDFLFCSSHSNSDIFYCGVEVFLDGVAGLLKKLEDTSLSNIKIYNGNVHHMLPLLQDNIFDKIYILFPDPWPKKKHNKRRLINEDTLKVFSRILKPNGILRFVSDHSDYVSWTLERFLHSGYFDLQIPSVKDFFIAPNDHIKTKYEQKAERNNSEVVFLHFQNNKKV